MRVRFDEQLKLLNREMITLGMLCEYAIESSVKALSGDDKELARSLVSQLEGIKQKEKDIETICLRLLLQQQPVARDLRVISSALKMITDMERIGTQSADIAEIVIMMEVKEHDKPPFIEDMAHAVIKMVKDSVDAFVNKDVNLAKSVIKYDDVVDTHFDDIKSYLIRQLKNEEAIGSYILDLLMIAKYFERIGDHAVNIASWVVFSIIGSHEENEEA